MWEAIRANRRRSRWLIAGLALLLGTLGAAIGGAWGYPRGALVGAAGALVLWLLLYLVARGRGQKVLLSFARARRIQKQDAPRLWNVVEEMTIAAGLSRMPAVYVVDDDAPNAFAVGCTPQQAALAVTAGLLKRLDRDELQGVVAHEIGHICNLDTRFMTLAAVMAGSIVLIADGFRRALWYGAGRRRLRVSSRGGAQVQLVLLAVALLLALLAPLCAQLLYFACSRRREYLADASAARLTRYPPGLASALEKISRGAGRTRSANRALAPLYIVNPLRARAAAGLFSTHPPVEQRIRILRNMGGGAGFADYERAYRAVHGQRSRCLGGATLAAGGPLPARAAAAEAPGKTAAIERARQVADLLDRLANFLLIPCPCGVRIKVPPHLTCQTLRCPRCGRQQRVPQADKRPPGRPAPALRYRRRGAGWESFRCTCGHPLQLSPSFSAAELSCPKCRARIAITTRADRTS